MILEVGDRVLIKERKLLDRFLPFKKRKYDWIANVISHSGEIIDFSPPTIDRTFITKYSDNPEKYHILVLRPMPTLTIAQKAIWSRKIRMMEGKNFSTKNKNVNINNITNHEFIGAGVGTLLADNHCQKLSIETISSPSDYLKLVDKGEFEILYDSQE